MIPATILLGNCVDRMREMPDASIDAIVTDPPYGLSKEPDMAEVLRHWLDEGLTYKHRGGGFMGKSWDSFVPGPVVWREVLRVLKPGGHALVFSGTRTYDLTVLAMRIAGFEIRDQLEWLYGSGFPKSLDVSKAIGERLDHPNPPHNMTCSDCGCALVPIGSNLFAEDWQCACTWAGWGTALKPAHEPIVLARKPLAGTVAANVLAHGTGGINVDGCRIGTSKDVPASAAKDRIGQIAKGDERGRKMNTDGFDPNVGRWPANVLFDEAAAALLDEQTGQLVGRGNKGRSTTETDPVSCYGKFGPSECGASFNYDAGGGASRFFYVAKASRSEREAGLDHLPVRSGGDLTDREDGSAALNSPRTGAGRGGGRRNNHPTVKPVALMRHLVRMITPPGGTVLDPFAGSGSTLCAAVLEGFASIGIELTPEYVPIIDGRIAAARSQPWLFDPEQSEPEAVADGLVGGVVGEPGECPVCLSVRVRVVDTRPFKDTIRRWRRCRRCNAGWTTEERILVVRPSKEPTR